MKSFTRVILLFFILFGLFPVENSRAELSAYVKKYNDISISQTDLRNLDRYEHLIRYFCSFSYFKPRHKVSPDFIKALILAESGCDPRAISSKQAFGLGQIILSTGRETAKEIYDSQRYYRYIDMERLKNLSQEDLFDPAINILLTCYLISKYNFLFQGKLELVISAWNAGVNVDSLKVGKPAPYKETHNLIGKVNGYYIDLLKKRKRS